MPKTIALAFSGGLDTSVCVKWLQEKYAADVVTVTLDLGQQENLADIEKRSKLLGAKKHYTIDAKKEFVSDYVFPAIKANAMYEGKYPLSTALGRPLIAKKLVEVAEKEGAFAVAHGSTGKGNDQVRLDVSVRAMNPDLEVIAPVRDWNMARDEEIVYAQNHGYPDQAQEIRLQRRPEPLGPFHREWAARASGDRAPGRRFRMDYAS